MLFGKARMAKDMAILNSNLMLLAAIFSTLIAVVTSRQSSAVHHDMNKKELSRYFGTDIHDQVPDYEVVSPMKVNKNGELLSHELSHNDESPGLEKHEDLHYNIKAFGENFHLHLKKNHKLFAKDLKVEVLGHQGKILRKEKVRNCYYHGHSKNHPKSRATLSTCDNLAGAIHVANQSYFIEPLPRHLADRYKRSEPSKSHPHIIYKSGISKIQRRQRSTITKRKTTFCGTEDDPIIRLPRDLDVEQGSRTGDDSKDPERYIETLVVVDDKMCAFHGEDAAKQFTLSACNIASGLLKDSSIGSNPINLVITKMQIHTIPQEGLLINNHAMNSLSSFGKWAERNTVPDDSDPQHYDYATLFTRYDICKDKNQPCDTLGVTNVGGMCQFPNSVSICEDNGLMVGKTLAHETGHSLGMNHDLSPFCGDSKKMMSLHPEGSDAYEWSKCSRMFLKQFLDSSDSRCLEDKPTSKQAINVQAFSDPGLLYSADQQCALSYGDGAKYCKDKSAEQMCAQLWCSIPSGEGKTCHSLTQPLADGTTCGDQKWCKRGKCVAKYTEGPDAIDGGWSNWSQDYTECTRSCSGGVQYRTRQCNNPLPTNGGKFCDGEHREYRLCNTKNCVEEDNFRNEQCEAKNKEMFNDKFFEWEWRASNLMNECTLGCFIKSTDQGYAFGNVEDGTDCDDDSNSKCINGECMHIGCDNVIGSSAKFDRCGICNGDGSTCRYDNSTDEELKANLTQKYKEQGDTFKKTLSLLHKMGYSVPADYASAKMNEVVSDFYWAVIKTGCSATCGGGTEITNSECRRSDDGSPVAEKNCDVKAKPTHKRTRCNTKPCQPEWRTDRWEDCSRTCNGGSRARHVRCVEIVDGGIEYDVEDEMCDADLKPNTKEECNKEECKPEWVAQPFGTCSTSCGRGVQNRKIKCQKVSKDGDTEDVEEEKCSDFLKPNSEEYCNVHNPCPGEGECGGTYNKNKGFITSPGFPDNYPNGKECMHSITVTSEKVIKLVFKSLDLNGGLNSDGVCTGDFVKIMDGDCISGQAEARYCGNRDVAPFLSTGNKLCVKFFSDESRNGKGFNASFQAVDHPARPKDPCGSTITATVGLLASPNYPEPYPTNELCNMTIKTLEGPIKLNFEYFDIGKDANCDEDYLLLHGDSDVSKLCGSNLPKAYNVSGNMLQLSFKSGQQNLNKLGFIATYVSGKEAYSKDVEKMKTDDKPARLSEINTVNDLTDSVRDTIPRPSDFGQKNSVKFLSISSNSMDSKEVAKEEISSHSSRVSVSSKSTAKDVKNKSVSASVNSTTGAESAKVNKSKTMAKKDSRQTVLRPLQSVLEQSGALMTRGQCPHPSKLSCLNLLYSYPCENNEACQLRGMDCCPTSCSYGPNMCVPKVWRECPLVTPYIAKVLHTCSTSADCDPNHICCIDMLGRRYCHKHEAIDK